MKKLIVILSLFVLLCTLLSTGIMATSTEVTDIEDLFTVEGTTAVQSSEQSSSTDEMPPMEFEIDGEAFVDSLGLMGQGMIGIFIVTLVIIGVVAVLNWHSKTLEKRNNKK